MNKKFDIISMILIIALTIILVAFVFNYFAKSNSDELSPVTSNSTIVATDIVENMSGSNTVIISTPVVENVEKVPENTSTIIDIGDSKSENEKLESGEGIIEEVYTNPVEIANQEVPTLFITSNDNISDKEKKEVLKELDETLMDLLDVIENVQTVDESRLPTEESEVQP